MKTIKLLALLTLIGCTTEVTEKTKIVFDTIPYHLTVPLIDSVLVPFYYPVPKDSVVVVNKDTVTEISGINIQFYGSNKVIRGDLHGATINFYTDSIDVSINDTIIRMITPTDTIYLKPEPRTKGTNSKYLI